MSKENLTPQKKSKKEYIIVGTILAILIIAEIILKIVTNIDSDSDKNTKKDDQQKQNPIVSGPQMYKCSSGVKEGQTLTIENVYEFTLDNNEAMDEYEKLIIIYNDEKEYKEAYYANEFAKDENFIKVENDDENMVTTITLKGVILTQGETMDEENAFEILSQANYKCEKKNS